MNKAEDSRSAGMECMNEASEWLIRLREDSVTDAVIAEWLKWCAADAENLKAFDDLKLFYDQLRALGPPERRTFMYLTRLAGGSHAIRFRIVQYCVLHAGDLRRHLFNGAAAAGLLALALAWYPRWRSLPIGTDAKDYRASRGNQQALILADQSHVTLGAQSEVLSHFTAHVRAVELRRGEAFFEIKHDADRPFVVTTNGVTVTAVGTKFNVRRSAGRTVIVVAEGAVDVSTVEPTAFVAPVVDNDLSSSTPVRVVAGQRAIHESAQRGLIISDTDPTVAMAWVQGRLAYIMEPLGSVIEDVNRYSPRQIVVSDPRVNALTFTGTIFREHIDTWAFTLEDAFPVAVSATPDGTIKLSMRLAGQ